MFYNGYNDGFSNDFYNLYVLLESFNAVCQFLCVILEYFGKNYKLFVFQLSSVVHNA